VRLQAWRWLRLGIGIGVAAQVLLLAGDRFADRLTVPGIARGDIYQHTLGWRALGADIAELARRANAPTVTAARRDDIASLLYYLRAEPRRVLAWPEAGLARDHFQLTRPLADDATEPILLVARCAAPVALADGFATVEPLGSFAVPTGPTMKRDYFAFKLTGRKAGALRSIC
jgi:hypothetical protein